MLKKLRWKVTLVITGIIFIVLGLLVIGINIANRNVSARGSDNLLKMIAENEGRMPEYTDMEQRHPDMWSYEFTEETPYDTRFFVIWVDEEMQMTDTQMDAIVSVTDEDAEEYLEKAILNGRTFGYVGSYRFYKCTDYEQGFFVFLDCSRQLYNSRNLLRVSLLVFGAAMCLTFLLAFLLAPKAIAPLVKNVERQKQFITNAGHEIKTPLTVITACADVLEMEMPGNEWVDGIKGETKRMKELVSDLVMLSRWEEAHPILERQEFSLSRAVKETAAPFESLCRARSRILSMEMPEGISFYGDEPAIRKLLSIFLDNAVKYSREGSDIRLRFENRHRSIGFFIENECVPGEAVDLSRLFERFYRGEQSRAREMGGSGIGLSIARAIAEAHGGRIQVSSPQKESICFHIILPKDSQSFHRIF